MQATDLTTAPNFDSPAVATTALLQQNGILNQSAPSSGAPGSASQQARKRGRPSTKGRQSHSGTVAGTAEAGPLYLGTNNNNNFTTIGMASPQYTNGNQNNGLFPSATDAFVSSPAHFELTASANSTAEKTKRIRRDVDDQQLTVPFEFGWSRIVRFRWQAPGSQILAEVTYKSPSGRIFRSYAKINEYLAAEQANAQETGTYQINCLTPENFSFSSRARITGTTFQKTTTSSQGLKEYREMTPDEVDLLFATMTETSRNKLANPTSVYEQIFGAYQQIESTDHVNGVQDFSLAKPAVVTNDVNSVAVNLSMPVNNRQQSQPSARQPAATTAADSRNMPVSVDNNNNKLFSPSTLTNSNSVMLEKSPVHQYAGSNQYVGTGVGTGDEQQAMLMFMAAMFMQQQQQQQQGMTLFPPRTIDTDNGAAIGSPSTRDKATKQTRTGNNNENLSISTATVKNKLVQDQIMANVMSSIDQPMSLTSGNIQTAERAKSNNLAENEEGRQNNYCDADQQQIEPWLAMAGKNKAPPSEDQTKKQPTSTSQVVKTSTSMSSVDREILRLQKWRKRQQERRIRLIELKQELNRQPADDMLLVQRRSLPELPRFAMYSLLATDNQAIADCLQSFEFVQTFAGVLGLDVNGLPSLASLERGIAAADRQSLLEVTDLLCRLVAIGLQDTTGWIDGAVREIISLLHGESDPRHGQSQPLRSAVVDNEMELWQQLPKLPIDRMTVSEASRQFLFVRNEGRQTEEVRNLSETLFQTMNPGGRARVLAAVCDELLGYNVVLSEIERNLVKSVDLKRDLVAIQSQLRTLQQPPAATSAEMLTSPMKKQNPNDAESTEVEPAQELPQVETTTTEKTDCEKEQEDENKESLDAGDQTVEATADAEEGKTKPAAGAEIKRLTRQEKNCRNKLVEATNRIRALHMGFDRFGRSFWNLPHVGALLVHGSDFSQAPEAAVEKGELLEKVKDEEESKLDTDVPISGDVNTDIETADVQEQEVVTDSSDPVENIEIVPIEDAKVACADNNDNNNNQMDDESTSTDSSSSSSESDDDMEKMRWSPPPNYLTSPAQQPQPQQQANTATNSPKLPRRRKSTSRPRKSNTSNNNNNNNLPSSGAIDLSQPNTNLAANNGDLANSSVGSVMTVTVDPKVLLQNFLMFARSLGMPGLSSQPALNLNQAPCSSETEASNLQSKPEESQPNELGETKQDDNGAVQVPSALTDNFSDEPSSAAKHGLKVVHFEDEGGEVTDAQPTDNVPGYAPSSPIQQAEENEPNSPPSEPEVSPTTLANKELLHDTLQPIPSEMLRGWWRFTSMDQVNALIHSLNPHGVRERNLLRNLQRNLTGLENVLANSSSIDVTTRGDFFKVEESSADKNSTTCDLNALKTEIELEAFTDIAAVAKVVLTPNNQALLQSAPSSGRGRPGRKSQTNGSVAVVVKDMPQVNDFNDNDENEVENETPNNKLERAKRLLIDIAYSLAARKMLNAPFAVVPPAGEPEDDAQDKTEAASVYQFSDAFLRFIQAVKKASTWSAVKLRLVQLEASSSVRFPKETGQMSSPKKQQRNTKEELVPADGVESLPELCRQLLESLREHVDSEPFLYPVSRVEYPSYFEIIESPMDLQTIDNKIHQNCYRSLNDFASDVRLIFNNCHQFNANGSEIYEQASRLKRWFERRLKQLSA